MINKSPAIVVILGINVVFAVLSYLGESAFAQTNNTRNVTKVPAQTQLTDIHRYNNGYNDGLKNSQADFKASNGQQCNPSVPTDVEHTGPYIKGYAVGYSKGPCGGKAALSSSSSSSSQSNSSAFTIPGILP